jgi:hypothetical protein
VEETLEIGNLTFNADTGFLEYALLRTQNYDVGSGFSSGNSKSTYDNVINLGFMDPESGASRWLLEHSEGLVVGRHSITRGNERNPTHVATVLRWITKDTTGDRRLSASDAGDLYLVDPDGTGLTLIANDIEKIARNAQFSDDAQIMDWIRGGVREWAVVSLSSKAVEKTLSPPEF